MTRADDRPDAELGELLSAHLDGELTPDEARRVAERLAADPVARAEQDELARVRQAVRGLPAVEPPVGFYEDVLRTGDPVPALVGPPAAPGRRRRRSRVLAGVAGLAVAAALVVVVALAGSGGGDDPMVPPVAEFAARHEAVAMAEGGAAAADDGFEPMSADELDAMEGPMAAPAELPGEAARLAGYHDDAGTMHVVYGAGDGTVSVYAQPGRVDFAALPDGGERMEMDGDDAWLAPDVAVDGRSVEVLVLQRGDTAYTFVADAPHAVVVAVAEGLAAAT